jgi:hypothetical protein
MDLLRFNGAQELRAEMNADRKRRKDARALDRRQPKVAQNLHYNCHSFTLFVDQDLAR